MSKVSGLQFLAESVGAEYVPPYFVLQAAEVESLGKFELRKKIEDYFGCGELFIIRSSASIEDTLSSSCAGVFESSGPLGLRDDEFWVETLKVLESYRRNGCTSDSEQIIYQTFVRDTQSSGVVLTVDHTSGAPYYVINYDDVSGNTSTVTSGTGESSGKVLYVRKDSVLKVNSSRFGLLLRLVRKLEISSPHEYLDIEFCINRAGRLFLLQIRPLACQVPEVSHQEFFSYIAKEQQRYRTAVIRKYPRTLGSENVWGLMPDWNPVELLGRTPSDLDFDLFDRLIAGETWALGRKKLGYRYVSHPLVTMFVQRPYVNARLSFNSFIPDQMDDALAEKLIDCWLVRLSDLPHLHDKVEFEIATTCFEFDMREVLMERFPGIFCDIELTRIVDAYRILTSKMVDVHSEESLYVNDENVASLLSKNSSREILCLDDLETALSECINLGVLSFVAHARHAFVARTLMNSLIRKNLLPREIFTAIERSVETVTDYFVRDLEKLNKGAFSDVDFFKSYGHLRPNSFDITSETYSERADIFRKYNLKVSNLAGEKEKFIFNNSSFPLDDINKELGKLEVPNFDFYELQRYFSDAVKRREHSKFVWTKTLSQILDFLKIRASFSGIPKDDISYLRLSELQAIIFKEAPYRLFEKTVESRKNNKNIAKRVRVPIIWTRGDQLEVIPYQALAPNYITHLVAKGPVLEINSKIDPSEVNGKIILIENADPGFDWLFSSGLNGLITMFGGVNSHMAIRCAEFGLPAAIGVGEPKYESIKNASFLEIDCLNCSIREVISL